MTTTPLTKTQIGREMRRHPPTIEYHEFNNDEIKLRREIAKYIWNEMMDMDATINPTRRALYNKYPPWAFFTDLDGNLWRVYGLKSIAMIRAVRPDGRSQIATEVPANSLIMVDDWTANQKWNLKQSGNGVPGCFLDPLGMIFVLGKMCGSV
jgi:hypothetical protein